MKIAKRVVTSINLVNDNGTKLHPEVEKKAFRMMKGFQQDQVLGGSSRLNDVAALRMVASVMERFDIRAKAGTEFTNTGTLRRSIT